MEGNALFYFLLKPSQAIYSVNGPWLKKSSLFLEEAP